LDVGDDDPPAWVKQRGLLKEWGRAVALRHELEMMA
jgi:hypothetical protein